MVKVITYGTFDTFHYGHFFLLERAKALGTHLSVCISTDEFNLREKGKSAKLNFVERLRIIKIIIPKKNLIIFLSLLFTNLTLSDN